VPRGERRNRRGRLTGNLFTVLFEISQQGKNAFYTDSALRNRDIYIVRCMRGIRHRCAGEISRTADYDSCGVPNRRYEACISFEFNGSKIFCNRGIYASIPLSVEGTRLQSGFRPADLKKEGREMRSLRLVTIALCAALLCAAFGTSARADKWDRKTVVTFGDAVAIPGNVLPPGTYVFKLAGVEGNRNVVQILSEDQDHVYATLMAVSTYRSQPTNHVLFRFDEGSGDSPQVLKSWFYPGDTRGIDFVYSNSDYDSNLTQDQYAGH
jgi:hypothetical protein